MADQRAVATDPHLRRIPGTTYTSKLQPASMLQSEQMFNVDGKGLRGWGAPNDLNSCSMTLWAAIGGHGEACGLPLTSLLR